MAWQTRHVSAERDLLAPDGSEIRLLVQLTHGSLVHCTLQPGLVTQAVKHRTVEEVWYCTAGHGQLWRQTDDAGGAGGEFTELEPGVAVTIPLGTRFQFRATGDQPLEVIITTMPPWPGETEAVAVHGPWTPTPALA